MKLSIILVTYNTGELISNVLNSIKIALNDKINLANSEVIVVDNASTDNSVATIRSQFPWVKLIVNSQNLGFASGNNLGISRSQGEYVMLLNADTLITDPHTFEKLVDYVEDHQDVGAISPKLVLPDGIVDLACHRGFPTPWNAFCYFTGLESLFSRSPIFAGYHQTWKDFRQIHEVDAVAGAAMLVRRRVIEEVGFLDERFPMYAEDIDWCYRIKAAGWKIIYYPYVSIIHLKSQAGKAKKQNTAEYQFASHSFYQTMKQFYDKHYHNRYPQWLKPIVFLGIHILALFPHHHRKTSKTKKFYS